MTKQQTCPCCGQRAHVQTADEGTASYVGDEYDAAIEDAAQRAEELEVGMGDIIRKLKVIGAADHVKKIAKRYEKFAKRADAMKHTLHFAWQELTEDDPMDRAMASVIDKWRWKEAIWNEEGHKYMHYEIAPSMERMECIVVAYLEGVEAELRG